MGYRRLSARIGLQAPRNGASSVYSSDTASPPIHPALKIELPPDQYRVQTKDLTVYCSSFCILHLNCEKSSWLPVSRRVFRLWPLGAPWVIALLRMGFDFSRLTVGVLQFHRIDKRFSSFFGVTLGIENYASLRLRYNFSIGCCRDRWREYKCVLFLQYHLQHQWHSNSKWVLMES